MYAEQPDCRVAMDEQRENGISTGKVTPASSEPSKTKEAQTDPISSQKVPDSTKTIKEKKLERSSETKQKKKKAKQILSSDSSDSSSQTSEDSDEESGNSSDSSSHASIRKEDIHKVMRLMRQMQKKGKIGQRNLRQSDDDSSSSDSDNQGRAKHGRDCGDRRRADKSTRKQRKTRTEVSATDNDESDLRQSTLAGIDNVQTLLDDLKLQVEQTSANFRNNWTSEKKHHQAHEASLHSDTDHSSSPHRTKGKNRHKKRDIEDDNKQYKRIDEIWDGKRAAT